LFDDLAAAAAVPLHADGRLHGCGGDGCGGGGCDEPPPPAELRTAGTELRSPRRGWLRRRRRNRRPPLRLRRQRGMRHLLLLRRRRRPGRPLRRP
jgi:hypothetical protein